MQPHGRRRDALSIAIHRHPVRSRREARSHADIKEPSWNTSTTQVADSRLREGHPPQPRRVIARSSLDAAARGGRGARRGVRGEVARRWSRRCATRRRSTTRMRTAALTAAALMGMNNVWYPYVEMAGDDELKTLRAELRMNAYATHGGVDRRQLRALRAGGVDRRQVRVLRRVALQAAAGIGADGAAIARRRPHRGGDQRRRAGACRAKPAAVAARPRGRGGTSVCALAARRAGAIVVTSAPRIPGAPFHGTQAAVVSAGHASSSSSTIRRSSPTTRSAIRTCASSRCGCRRSYDEAGAARAAAAGAIRCSTTSSASPARGSRTSTGDRSTRTCPSARRGSSTSGRWGRRSSCFPTASRALGGNQYVNSSAIGRYADYLTREIIPFVDREFRTLASRDHRGCFGKSSGGYGAIIHGMRYPQYWGAIADHSGDALLRLLSTAPTGRAR